MAQDLQASRVTIGFTGGALTGTKGVLEAVFGPSFVTDAQEASTQITRRAHQRRRRIGGPATSVAGASYSNPKVTSPASGSTLGGEAIRVLVDGSWWTLRLSGSHKAFNQLLKAGSFGAGRVVFWRSEAGRRYGPFSAA